MEIQERAEPLEAGVGRPPWFCLLALVASAALMLPLDAVEASLGEAPRLAWCGLLWVAALSLPQSREGSARWSVGLGLGLCVLGLAAHLDRSRGASVEELWDIAWPALLFAVLLGGAAARARATDAAARHALLWIVFVPGAPLLSHALGTWGGAPLPRWLEFLSELSPLRWLAASAAGEAPMPWLPLGVAVLLFSVAATAQATEGEELA